MNPGRSAARGALPGAALPQHRRGALPGAALPQHRCGAWEAVRWVGRSLRDLFRDAQVVSRDKATELADYEARELEHIFTLLLFGSFTGLPSPPVHLTLQLLPLMEREMTVMFHRVGVAHDALAEIVSVLGEP